MFTHDATPSAFLDIATNLLAVMLILTLFALAWPQRPQGTPSASASARSTWQFVEPRRELFPPFSRFYFVLADRVVAWDQGAVLDALRAQAPTARSGTTWQGRFEWQPDPLPIRDIDGFRLRFYPDRAALLAQAPVWSDAEIADFVAALEQAAEARIAPVFLVQPDGMERFADLYQRLRARGLRLRWFPQQPDTPVLLGRHPDQFTHHVSYW